MSKLHRSKKYILAVFAVLLVGVIGAAAYYYSVANAVVRQITTSGTAADLLTPQPLNGEQTGAVNILIAGNSVDDPGHGGAALTDSIMVAHYDLNTHALALISVPRDLYVNVNGTYMKINAAYENGGMAELAREVHTVTGLTINQQVLIDYTALRDMIDALGGIDVTIHASDPRGIYDPMIGFSITNGPHHLNGADALLLARCRNDPTYDGRVPYGLSGGDFDRTANQRMIVQAMLEKLNNGAALVNPETMQQLLDSLSGNVTSDFTVGQLRRLYDLSKQISSQQSISLGGTASRPLLTSYTSPTAGATLVPVEGVGDYTAIQQYVASVTTGAVAPSNANTTPSTSAD